jgi:hypothetical protein
MRAFAAERYLVVDAVVVPDDCDAGESRGRRNGEIPRQSRYWAVRLLDEESLLACAAYVDLNPIRAAMAETLQASDHTSAQRRIEAERARAGSMSDAEKRGLPTDDRRMAETLSGNASRLLTDFCPRWNLTSMVASLGRMSIVAAPVAATKASCPSRWRPTWNYWTGRPGKRYRANRARLRRMHSPFWSG